GIVTIRVTVMVMKSREPGPGHPQSRGRVRGNSGVPLVPAKAGTQVKRPKHAALDSRLRGNERERCADSPPTDSLSANALYRLLAWLSPAYPIGAFSYSSGIEWAVEAGDIREEQTLRDWLEVVIGAGGGFCDAVFLVHAHRAITNGDDAALRG